MVQVKKPGVTEENWKYEFKCSECKAELEGTVKDLKLGQFGGDYTGDGSESKYYMECPTCKDVHFVKGKIPANIASKAKRDR